MSNARIDPKNLDDSEIVKESAGFLGSLPETLIYEELKKARLNDSGRSGLYKDTPSVEKPETEPEKVEVAPSSNPTPSVENMVVDDELMITGTHQGVPPARTVLEKVLDSKEQVVSRPHESISEKTSLEELYRRSLACTTKQHGIVLQLRQRYEVFYLFPILLSLYVMYL